MQRLGYVRSKLDIKILILYFLSKMREPASDQHLNELAYIDGAIDYFDFMECLASLKDTGHIETLEGGLVLTATGARNCQLCQSSLSYTVRKNAEKMAEEFTASVRRGRNMDTAIKKTQNGEYAVHMELRDDRGPVLSMDVPAPDIVQAKRLEDGFRARAEEICGRVIELLTKEEKNEAY